MNYQTPARRRALAADYAIGLMPATASRHFDRLLLNDPALRIELAHWQETLASLTLELPDEPVPERVWKAINARLDPAAPKRLWWIWLSSGALAFLLVLAVSLSLVFNHESVNYRATLVADSQQAALKVEAHRDYIEVEPLAVAAVANDRSLELWAIAPGAKPVSLGVMPSDHKVRLQLNASQRQLLGVDVILAVTLEPHGGSPSGAPTGPILYKGLLAAL